jgi:hypothetical protein
LVAEKNRQDQTTQSYTYHFELLIKGRIVHEARL